MKLSFRRDGSVRARTLTRRSTRGEIHSEALVQYPEWGDQLRPRVRGDCVDEERPCPWVSCRHHLFVDVVRRQLKENFPEREVWDLEESCSLDVADRGGTTLDEVGKHMNVVRERVRQIEAMALGRVGQYDAEGMGDD